MTKTAPAERLQAVVMRQSAMDSSESWHAVSAVVDFVNDIQRVGLFYPTELPEHALQSYHADYYLAQVNNGGHSQFIHNLGQNYPLTVRNAELGLEAMGADEHLATLRKMIKWVKKNPKKAAAQTGFSGGRDEYLDKLDSEFYAVEGKTPMADLNKAWIQSWQGLRLVSDEAYGAAMNETAKLNEHRDIRMEKRQVDHIKHRMSDPLWLGIATAVASDGQTNVLMNLGNGSYEDLDGEKAMAFRAATAKGQKFAFTLDDRVEIRDLIQPDNPEMPDLSDAEGMSAAIADGRMAQFKSPSVGEKLGEASTQSCAKIAGLAADLKAPVALQHLLSQLGDDAKLDGLSPVDGAQKPETQMSSWLVLVNKTPYYATFTRKGALLRNFENVDDIIAKAPIEEIAAREAKLSAAA